MARVDLDEKKKYYCVNCGKAAFICTVDLHARAAMRGLEPVCANCSDMFEVDEGFSEEHEAELEQVGLP